MGPRLEARIRDRNKPSTHNVLLSLYLYMLGSVNVISLQDSSELMNNKQKMSQFSANVSERINPFVIVYMSFSVLL